MEINTVKNAIHKISSLKSPPTKAKRLKKKKISICSVHSRLEKSVIVIIERKHSIWKLVDYSVFSIVPKEACP